MGSMEEIPLFSDKTKSAQKAAMENRWEDFKNIMKDDKENLLKQFDLFKNTAIHVATRSNDPQLLKELIEVFPKEDRWQVMCNENCEGNTILHEVVFCKKVQVADVVFEKEDELLQPQSPGEKRSLLLELRNRRGETPLFMAAMHGKLKMLDHMVKRVPTHREEDVRKHFHRFDKYSALHASVMGQHFDVAVWLLGMDKELAMQKDEKDLTCLQLLSNMPQVFRSHTHMGPVKSLIYDLLPIDGYEIEDGGNFQLSEDEKDIESGKMEERKHCKPVISNIKYGFWKLFTKVFEGIRHMRKEKKKHKLAECLTNKLVKYDLSWQISHNDSKRTTIITMPRHPLHVAKRRRIIALKREERRKYDEDPPDRTALCIATKAGIVEIVEKFLDVNPEAIFHVNENKQNLLNMVVRYRQKKILQIIKKKGALVSLVPQITKKGRTILHDAARMYKAEHLAGVAFQLQNELRWYHKVRKMIPEHYNMHCDIDGHTPEDMLAIEHDEMLKEAQKWLKETAQSCSTVAILVATVVFAAAYAIPGGTEKGTPVFLHSHVFLFFTIMDIMALVTLASFSDVVPFHPYFPM
ncbi:Ankyrin repeat-containing protein [Spatholobus suberectus]|nr:Ankyrin repeat-containing protein [Spatholobus suberectus]